MFTKNRDRLLGGEIAGKFFGAVLDEPAGRGLLSDEHFSVDGTLIEAWASMKSFRPKDGSRRAAGSRARNGERDFHGEKRRTKRTPRPPTPMPGCSARATASRPSRLCFIGHVLMENRNGLVVDAELTRAAGTAERMAALAMAEPPGRPARASLGADKGYDTQLRHGGARARHVTPHVAQNAQRDAPLGDRRPHHSPSRLRAQPEKAQAHRGIFGWLKTIGGLRKTNFRGLDRVGGCSPSPLPPTT